MKTILTTAAIVAALSMPAFAQSAGTDSRGDTKGSVKSSTSIQDNKGPNAQDTSGSMNQGSRVKPGTTGAGSANTNTMNPSESEKSTSGADGSGGGGSGGAGGGSGGGSR